MQLSTLSYGEARDGRLWARLLVLVVLLLHWHERVQIQAQVPPSDMVSGRILQQFATHLPATEVTFRYIFTPSLLSSPQSYTDNRSAPRSRRKLATSQPSEPHYGLAGIATQARQPPRRALTILATALVKAPHSLVCSKCLTTNMIKSF